MTVTGSRSAPLVRGKVARFTLVDACGVPQITNSVYVTEAFVTVQSTKNVDTGDEIKVRHANGQIGVYEPGKPTVVNFEHQIQFSKMDVGALQMLTGDPAVLNAVGDTIVGWEELTLVPLTQHFGLEIWTDTSGSGTCVGANKLYGYLLYPHLSNAYLTIDDVTDKEITGHITAMSFPSQGWGRGPYGGVADGSSIRGPINTAVSGAATAGRLLVAVDSRAGRRFELTEIPPPASFVTPGPISMTLPSPY
jgi:hypothetical protein